MILIWIPLPVGKANLESFVQLIHSASFALPGLGVVNSGYDGAVEPNDCVKLGLGA